MASDKSRARVVMGAVERHLHEHRADTSPTDLAILEEFLAGIKHVAHAPADSEHAVDPDAPEPELEPFDDATDAELDDASDKPVKKKKAKS